MKSIPIRKDRGRVSGAVPAPVPDEQLSPAVRKIEAAFRAIMAGHVTVRQVEIPEPGRYDARAVRKVREKLDVSIAVFAQLDGHFRQTRRGLGGRTATYRRLWRAGCWTASSQTQSDSGLT